MGTGMVFALQSYIGFKRVGGSQFIGSVVALAMARELGPVLTGLMVTGRSGSAITAEIGTMRITEQIDALTTLRINPFQYLIAPRIIAGLLVIPCLTLFCILCGVIGGYIVCVLILDLNPEEYISSIQSFVRISDVINGVIKSCAFGFIITSVGTYMGYHTRGGARGVGVATTNSVVISSVMILIADYVLTKLIEQI